MSFNESNAKRDLKDLSFHVGSIKTECTDIEGEISNIESHLESAVSELNDLFFQNGRLEDEITNLKIE